MPGKTGNPSPQAQALRVAPAEPGLTPGTRFPAIPAWRHVRAGAPKTDVPRPTQRLHGPFSLPQNLNEAQYAENQSKVHRQKS